VATRLCPRTSAGEKGLRDDRGHIGKGYIYGSMVFALAVELLNMRARRKRDRARAEARG
jgi:predicted tellurium resistance membrane protein TerC